MITLPDPNFFGGEPQLSVRKAARELVSLTNGPWSEVNFHLPFGEFANYRGAGVEEMVEAIIEDRPYRANADTAAHILEVLEGIATSIDTAACVAMTSQCQRPTAMEARP